MTWTDSTAGECVRHVSRQVAIIVANEKALYEKKLQERFLSEHPTECLGSTLPVALTAILLTVKYRSHPRRTDGHWRGCPNCWPDT